jgi:hypothetical protein
MVRTFFELDAWRLSDELRQEIEAIIASSAAVSRKYLTHEDFDRLIRLSSRAIGAITGYRNTCRRNARALSCTRTEVPGSRGARTVNRNRTQNVNRTQNPEPGTHLECRTLNPEPFLFSFPFWF